jgi:hypothetical protein
LGRVFWLQLVQKRDVEGLEDRKMSGTRISSLFGKITVLLIIYCCSFSAHAKYGGGKVTGNYAVGGLVGCKQ